MRSLCGARSDRLGFDLWRQLTVEHLIGEGQGMQKFLARINNSTQELAGQELLNYQKKRRLA